MFDSTQSLYSSASRPVTFTVWPDRYGTDKTEHEVPWSQFGELILNEPPKSAKVSCRLVKFALFGSLRTDSNCLRTDENCHTVTGIEGDVDGALSPAEALRRLAEHGLRGLVYPSWRWGPDSHRYRIILPLSEPTSPEERQVFVEILNGILGGNLATESATLSQSYFFGRPEGSENWVRYVGDRPDFGDYVDVAYLLTDLDQYRAPLRPTVPANGEALQTELERREPTAGERSVALRLAQQAAERTHLDPSLGRHLEVVKLGHFLRRDNIPYSDLLFDDVLRCFEQHMRPTDTSGALAELSWNGERRTLQRCYFKPSRPDAHEFDGLDWPDDGPRIAPAWLKLHQHRQEARDEADQAEADEDGWLRFGSVREALTASSAIAVKAGTGAGKTTVLVDLLVEALRLNNDETLVVASTETLNAMNDMESTIKEMVTAEEASRLLVLRSKRQSQPLIDGKSDDRPYRAVLCTHATLNSRGDNPKSAGRLLMKLEHARLVQQRPFHVLTVLDEGDAYLYRQERVIALGHRIFTDRDPNTARRRSKRIGICPKSCDRCNLTEWVAAGWTKTTEEAQTYQIDSSPNPPAHADPIDPKEIAQAMQGPTIIGAYRVHPLDENLISDRSLEGFTEDEETGDMLEALDGRAALHAIARVPGATVRTAHPRNRSGAIIEPGEGDKKETVWPHYACSVPHLVSWDPSPLNSLARLVDKTVFLSATFTPGSLQMLRHSFGDRPRAFVPTPEERRLRELVIIVTSRLAMSPEQAERLAAVQPALYVAARYDLAKKFYHRLYAQRSQTLQPAMWKRNGWSHEAQFGEPTFAVTYARSSISRAANLGRFRSLILEANAFTSLMNTPAFGSDPQTSIETERRAVIYQASGRHMRWDDRPEADDDGRRVLVYLSDTDPVTGELADDGAWLEERHRGSVEKVSRIMFSIHPERMPVAVEQIVKTGRCTVTDEVTEAADKLNPRRRQLTAGQRQEAKQAKQKAKKEERRRQLVERIEQMRAEGTGWREIVSSLHLTRHFSKEELTEMRAGNS